MTNRGPKKKRPRGDPSPEEQKRIFRRIAAMRRIKKCRGEKPYPMDGFREEFIEMEPLPEIEDDFMEDIDG